MKKLAICFMAACLSLTFIPLQAKETIKPASATEAPKPAEVKALELRINEINTMDNFQYHYPTYPNPLNPT